MGTLALAQAAAGLDGTWSVDTLKSLLNLGTAGLLLIGLLVVARVFGSLWLQMREVEQRSLDESRRFVRESIDAGKALSDTLRMTIVDATKLVEMMRHTMNSKE